MYKQFCDVCEKEIKRNYVGNRLKKKKIINRTNTEPNAAGCKTKIEIEVMVAVNGMWNEGTICEDCLMKVLKS